MADGSKAVNKLGIRYPKSGPPELIKILSEILSGMDRLCPVTTTDIAAAITAQGTQLRLRGAPDRPGAAGSDGPFPFDVDLVDLVPGTSKTATIRPGSVNNLIASNYLTPYTLLNANTYFLIVTVTASAGGVVTGAVLSFPTSAPSGMPVTVGNPPTSFTILIGMVIGGVWYRIIGDGSLQCTSAEAFRASKVAPAPGTLPYDIYYTWQVGNV